MNVISPDIDLPSKIPHEMTPEEREAFYQRLLQRQNEAIERHAQTRREYEASCAPRLFGVWKPQLDEIDRRREVMEKARIDALEARLDLLSWGTGVPMSSLLVRLAERLDRLEILMVRILPLDPSERP